jgi:hypothetical protein
MRRRDRLFAGACLGLTLLVPGLLLALTPIAEPRASLGTLVGWMVALGVMIPSYAMLSRASASGDAQAVIRGFMLGTLVRLMFTGAAAVLFVKLVENPPVKSFLLAFFLGYALLTTLELSLTLGKSHDKSHERTSA